MTPLGIEPTTFRLVAQCLNKLRYHMHLCIHVLYQLDKPLDISHNCIFTQYLLLFELCYKLQLFHKPCIRLWRANIQNITKQKARL
jgi:hypothetical protein